MRKYAPLLLGLAAQPLIASDSFDLKVNAHLNATLGASSADESAFASHAHDPNDEFTIQGLELNAAAKYGQYLSGFASYNAFLDDEDKIDGELEEAFLKLTDLPLGTELRAGRLLNRFGTQNNVHLHGWRFVDSNLTTGRFLGDEGLVTNSVELSYRLPVEHDTLLSVAFGDAIAHDHHHEEEGEEHHDHLEGEEALLADYILTARLKGIYKISDFKSFTYGLSGAWGDNGFGESGSLYSADLTYQWRENGIESGGRAFRATIEPIYREFDYAGEIEDDSTMPATEIDVAGSASEWGVSSHLGYSFNADWDADFRFDYLEGIGEPLGEIDERHRTSLALTRHYQQSDKLGGHVRLQYNHDWHEHLGQEDSIWLQFQIDFGPGGEIR